MQFQILSQHLCIKNNQLSFEDQVIDLNDKTQKALLLFLNSGQIIISKDQLLEHVWLGVIVSDASIFKQIQILRNLLVQAGLPNDSIENVYGKGYRLKYPAKSETGSRTTEFNHNKPIQHESSAVHVKQINSTAVSEKISGLKFSLVLALMLAVIAYYFWQQQKSLVNKLNEEQRNSIIELSKNDWQQGLDHLNQLLANAKSAYSDTDLAFLYQQKGQAEQQLQLIDESLVSLTESLQYYQLQEDNEGMGQAHLSLSKLYDYIDNPVKKQNHIKQAINLFNQVGDHNAEIDAYFELAYLQKKAGDIDESINTYELAIERARAVQDPTGEMIGINNLAATYMIINDTDKALELAEQGLAINLTLGNGQHIANSYSFLSQLAQQKGDISRAFKMIEQALKFQLETNSHTNLSAKLMSLNFLLLETHQYRTLKEILDLTDAYAQSLRIKGGASVIELYQGMQLAYQGKWSAALIELESAWQISTKSNFSYKRPMIMAFLALAEAQNNNHLKAVEFANKVLQDKQSGDRALNVAHLTLAISYSALENTETSQKWAYTMTNTDQIQWPIEQKIWLQFKLSQLPVDNITERNSLQRQILEAEQQMAGLATQNTLDENILNQLKTQVKDLIEQRNKN